MFNEIIGPVDDHVPDLIWSSVLTPNNKSRTHSEKLVQDVLYELLVSSIVFFKCSGSNCTGLIFLSNDVGPFEFQNVEKKYLFTKKKKNLHEIELFFVIFQLQKNKDEGWSYLTSGHRGTMCLLRIKKLSKKKPNAAAGLWAWQSASPCSPRGQARASLSP